jgi:hydroxymethylglutaryl-CoA lyase
MLPKTVRINELAPREGVQNEKNLISTDEKVRFIDLLSECNFPMIEAASFVSPRWVPQMADADEVVRRIKRHDGTRYVGIALNRSGIIRAFETGAVEPEPTFLVYASDTFARKNQNRSAKEIIADLPATIALWGEFDREIEILAVASAFGCNYEGDIAADRVLETIREAVAVAAEHGLTFKTLVLGDTVGWGTPLKVERLVGLVQDSLPDLHIRLHLHDTHGLGLANAWTGLNMGVDEFDASLGGLGGCPFNGTKDMQVAGNIVTEDLVNLCHESGIETGIDFERLLEVARQAEEIFGHRLLGRNAYAGSCESYRRAAAATPPAPAFAAAEPQ